jgi:hypothetical protein
MIRQNESTLPKLRVKPSWKKDGAATPVHRAATPSPKRGVFVTEKGPSFLKGVCHPGVPAQSGCRRLDSRRQPSRPGGDGLSGDALIITVGLRLYLVYLDHFLRQCE